jgi:hypothetical protein
VSNDYEMFTITIIVIIIIIIILIRFNRHFVSKTHHHKTHHHLCPGPSRPRPPSCLLLGCPDRLGWLSPPRLRAVPNRLAVL